MASYLITGSSRGLGLAMVRMLAKRPAEQVRTVIATAREENSELRQIVAENLGRVLFVSLDVTKPESISQAARTIGQMEEMMNGLDVLINNAGILNWTQGDISLMDDLMSTLSTNVNGPHLVTAALLPLLQLGQKKLIVNISILGSIARSEDYYYPSPNNPAYKISKTGLNMLTKQWSHAMAEENFTIFALNPGWLKTEIGGGEMADLTVEHGAERVLAVLDESTTANNGKFLDIHVPGWDPAGKVSGYLGNDLPW